MDKSLLVRLLGFPATLLHGDPLVAGRWWWLRDRLPRTANGERVLDVGCGTGAFTIGAARRGYTALGLSWDERNQAVASERAVLCRTPSATFEVLDVRRLDTRPDLASRYDVAICLEVAEHILDDAKLVRDVAACLKPGGRLYLTAPNLYHRAITRADDGPFLMAETGWHVRRGYSPSMLAELCREAGLSCEEIGYCGGMLSQKATWVFRRTGRLGPAVVLPLRPLIAALDGIVTRLLGYPQMSITLQAYKPRVAGGGGV